MSTVAEQRPRANESEASADSWRTQMPVLAAIWDRRRWLARFTAIGTVIVVLIALLIPARYDSRVQLMPPDSQSLSSMAMLAALGSSSLGSGAASSGLSGLASSVLGMKSTGETFISILQSRTVQDDLIDRFDLRKEYWVKKYVDARKKLGKRTDIEEDRKSGVISITVTDSDPQRAHDMASAYIDELNKLVTLLNTSAAHRERVFLETRLKTVKQDLDESSRQLSQFSSKNATLDLQAQGKAMMEAAADLQGKLVAAQSELRGLEAVYTGNNVRVQSVKAEIAELQQQMKAMGGVAQNSGSSDDAFEQLYPSFRQLPLLGLTFVDLYRRVRIDESVYEALTKQYELAKLEEAKEIPSVKVLDAPSYPERKSFPPRTIITVTGTLFVFFLGLALIIAMQKWDDLDPNHPHKLFVSELIHSERRWLRRRSMESLD